MGAGMLRPTWAEVSLDILRGNYRELLRIFPDTGIMPVIKADAYGHGAVEAAEALAKEGASIMGVATIEEGIQLREASVSSEVLVLGSVYPFKNFEVILEYGLTPIIASLEGALALNLAAEKFGRKASFHLKIDTGMGRIGLNPATAAGVWEELGALEWISCEGVFTHLACAGEESEYTDMQLDIFENFIGKIEKPRYVHASNTAGMFQSQRALFSLVRPGLALYGLCPEGSAPGELPFKPVLSWKSAVVFLKEVPAGARISYGGEWKAPVKSRIATICAGYADGYRRSLSGRARVIVRGVSCPVVGRVCMDMIMADVTGVGKARVGDEAVLIGSSGTETVTAEDMAGWAGTVNYEILTGISKRVPRVYIGSGSSKK